jgi:hypothetical protein
MEPNDHRNGVYLPRTNLDRELGDPRPAHYGLETQNYFHNVNEYISKNYHGRVGPHRAKCAQAFAALKEIQEALIANKFAH